MSYRTVYVREASEIRLRNNQLLVIKNGVELTVPLEDISIVLVENQNAIISTSLLGQLSEYNVGVVFCDKKHMPSVLCLPINNHYKQLRVFQMQNEVKKPVLSQCWQKIIWQKIYNQRMMLINNNAGELSVDKLSEYLKGIKSADNTNREAAAARIYFESLFGLMFSRERDSDDPINAALNYGYTILMSHMARLLTMYGFNTILGIHHCSFSNNYNLACDLMEPFRPAVDDYVIKNMKDIEYPLSPSNKKDLIEIMRTKMKINSFSYTIENAMEEMVLSLIDVYEQNDSELLVLPYFLQNNDCNE